MLTGIAYASDLRGAPAKAGGTDPRERSDAAAKAFVQAAARELEQG
jgi:hypothetical protein